MNSSKEQSEAGYVLILVMIVISVLTLVTMSLLNQTVGSSFLVARRVARVQAFALAESAAAEGLWQLKLNPATRNSQSYDWQEGWSRYEIIDSTKGTDDLSLTIIGTAKIGKQRVTVRFLVVRPQQGAEFRMTKWCEDP